MAGVHWSSAARCIARDLLSYGLSYETVARTSSKRLSIPTLLRFTSNLSLSRALGTISMTYSRSRTANSFPQQTGQKPRQCPVPSQVSHLA